MTTTVIIGVQGNKNVLIKTSSNNISIKPGYWMTLTMSGDQKIILSETGEFVVVGQPGYTITESKQEF